MSFCRDRKTKFWARFLWKCFPICIQQIKIRFCCFPCVFWIPLTHSLSGVGDFSVKTDLSCGPDITKYISHRCCEIDCFPLMAEDAPVLTSSKRFAPAWWGICASLLLSDFGRRGWCFLCQQFLCPYLCEISATDGGVRGARGYTASSPCHSISWGEEARKKQRRELQRS